MEITNEITFQKMLDVLRGDTIRGVVFSNYDELGYQNLYSFPPPIEELDVHLPIDKSLFKQWQQEKDQFFKKSFSISELPPTKKFGGLKDIKLFTERDFLQIAVKSISLLIGEKVMEKDPSLLNMQFYGILPYPDLQVYSYTFFRFYSIQGENTPRACTFSLLIDKAKKNFIYDNHDFLNDLIQNTVNSLIEYLEKGKWSSDNASIENIEKVQEIVLFFFRKLIPITIKSTITPLDSTRSKKIVFTGLRNSGKNSFLLALHRKYSKLVNRNPKSNDNIHMTNVLGTTVLNWETETDIIRPENITAHSEIYLDDADLLYFFIDGTNSTKVEESHTLFSHIVTHLEEERISIPIVVIISKVDKDIQNNPTIKDNISRIKTQFTNTVTVNRIHFFETSIFSLSTCLSAFSGGITLLMGEQKDIDDLLTEYSEKMNVEGIMLFNEFGLKFSHFIHPHTTSLNYPTAHSLEILGSQLITIYEKSQQPILAANNSTLTMHMSNTHNIVLKKESSPRSFYVVLYLPNPPSTEFYDMLNRLCENLIQIFGK